jgi:hypothetical protein
MTVDLAAGDVKAAVTRLTPLQRPADTALRHNEGYDTHPLEERTMSHRPPLTLWLVAPVAIAVLVGACTSTDPTANTGEKATTQSPDSRTVPSSHEPVDIMQLPEGTPLDPGTYSVGLLFDDGPARAIVNVPEGYFGGGGVIGSREGDLAFWGSVTQVDTDPCLGGRHVGAGTTVHDLAAELVAQRHMKASRPVPVTIGGYHGVHLTLTAPADLDRCRNGNVTILTAGGAWLQWDVPRATFHEWILNVHGTRVVGGARIDPDAANAAEMVSMVESATFTGVGHS